MPLRGGGFIHVCVQVSIGRDGHAIADPGPPFDQVLNPLNDMLIVADCTVDSIADVATIHLNMNSLFEALAAAKLRALPGPPFRNRTANDVVGLAAQALLSEIKVTG